MPKSKTRYPTFSFLPVLSGFIVFISSVIVAMTSMTGPKQLSLNGYVTVVSRGQSQTPVIVTAIKGQRSTLEAAGPKRSELLTQQGNTFTFNGKLTGVSGSYGQQFEVTSYVFPLK